MTTRKQPSVSIALLHSLLPAACIFQWCRELNYVWRTTKLNPDTLLYSMALRALDDDKTIQNVVQRLKTRNTDLRPSAWSQARSRLPVELLERAWRKVAEQTKKDFGVSHQFQGRPLYLADGTSVSMPDTPELAKAFGYSNSNRGRSKFPVARVVALLRAGLNAVVDCRMEHFQNGETTLLASMISQLPPGALLLADRLFSAFYLHALLLRRRVDFVMPLHQNRDPQKLIQAPDTQKLGPNDWLVTMKICPTQFYAHKALNLPQTLRLRLIRNQFRYRGKWKTIWLVTSLTDAKEYPAAVLGKLYKERWIIETDFGHLKTTLAAKVLRSKTESHVRQEFAALMLAYNLVWYNIHRAAKQQGRSPDRISYAGAIRTLLRYEPIFYYTENARNSKQLLKKLLKTIAANTVPHRPGRIEPRKLKRHKTFYPHLTKSREQERKSFA